MISMGWVLIEQYMSLHQYLAAIQVKGRLDGFEKDNDYMLAQFGEASNMNNSCNRIDYILTTDTAKSICMIERNQRGREIRQYFISCCGYKETALQMIVMTTVSSNDMVKMFVSTCNKDSTTASQTIIKHNCDSIVTKCKMCKK